MGIFDKFKGKDKEKEKKPKLNEQITAYKNIIELLELDADTAQQLNGCIHTPHAFYDEHAERYDERGIFSDTDDDTIIWLGIVDTLMEQGKMFEFDYSVELEDFIYGIQEINHHHLALDENALDEDSDITEWLKIISDEWMKSGYIIAGMDIDSDSYCVFITTRNAFDKLVLEAEKTGHKIALAQDM